MDCRLDLTCNLLFVDLLSLGIYKNINLVSTIFNLYYKFLKYIKTTQFVKGGWRQQEKGPMG